MKKYISVFTIMVMIFLAACSNQNTSSTPTSNENNTQYTKKQTKSSSDAFNAWSKRSSFTGYFYGCWFY